MAEGAGPGSRIELWQVANGQEVRRFELPNPAWPNSGTCGAFVKNWRN